MKRRDFLVASAGLAGLLGPRLGISQVRPCPPGTVGAEGGTTAATSCSAIDARSDWLSRISGPGVVWYHAFENEAEVNQFRWAGGDSQVPSLSWTGNDPTAASGDAGYMRRVASGGPGGFPFLEIRHTGSRVINGVSRPDPNVNWWRPFSALTGATNGRGVDDPGAGKPVRAWNPGTSGNYTTNWKNDYYGPQTYLQGFYLQMRVQRDPRRASPAYHEGGSGRHGGKHSYLTTTTSSLTAQEIVTFSGNGQGANSVGDFFRVYVSGSPPIEGVAYPSSIPGQQGGGELSTYPGNYCDVGTNPGRCWSYSTNWNTMTSGWDTLLYHIIPGSDGLGTTYESVSTFRLFAARAGQTAYTKVYDMRFKHNWSRATERGWNALLLNPYMNGNTFPGEFWHRFGQIIFSTEFIPCPQA